MNDRWRILVLATALAGCAHTKSTDKGAESQDQDAKKADAKTETAKPESAGRVARKSGAGGADERDSVPIASAPEGLLAPGAEKKIREKLAAGDFIARDAEPSDAAMREGLRKFQRAKDLPATGVPDHETVKRLGLDPDQIFRHGGVKD